jgi:hypothetical protein
MMLATINASSYVLIQDSKVQVAVGGAYYAFTIPTVTTTAWYHIAVVRESNNNWYVYWDGTKITGTVDAGDTDVNKGGTWWGDGTMTIGKFIDTRGNWLGRIDELRLSNVARYTSSFTPATSEFTNDSNTLALLHMNGINTSPYFVDDGPGTVQAVTAVSLIDGATSTTTTITIPAYAKPGDYAFLFDYSTTTTLVVPAGWTQVTTSTTTGIRSSIFYKRLLGYDIGTAVTGMAGTTRKVLVIVRPNGPVTSVTLSTPTQQATTAIPTNQTIAMVGQTRPLMGFAHYTSTGTITTRTGTGNTREFTSSVNQYVKTWTYNASTAASQTIGMSDGGTNALQGFYIRFS